MKMHSAWLEAKWRPAGDVPAGQRTRRALRRRLRQSAARHVEIFALVANLVNLGGVSKYASLPVAPHRTLFP